MAELLKQGVYMLIYDLIQMLVMVTLDGFFLQISYDPDGWLVLTFGVYD